MTLLLAPLRRTLFPPEWLPRPEDVAWSRKIIEAHAAAAARGEGVCVVDAKMEGQPAAAE